MIPQYQKQQQQQAQRAQGMYPRSHDGQAVADLGPSAQPQPSAFHFTGALYRLWAYLISLHFTDTAFRGLGRVVYIL